MLTKKQLLQHHRTIVERIDPRISARNVTIPIPSNIYDRKKMKRQMDEGNSYQLYLS